MWWFHSLLLKRTCSFLFVYPFKMGIVLANHIIVFFLIFFLSGVVFISNLIKLKKKKSFPSSKIWGSTRPTSGSAPWRWSRTSSSVSGRRSENRHRWWSSTWRTQTPPSAGPSLQTAPSWTLQAKLLHLKVGDVDY